MPIKERLKQLAEEKEIVPSINESLRVGASQTRETLLAEVRTLLPQLVQEAISNIRVQDGKDGRSGVDGKTPSKGMLLNLIDSVLPKPKEQKIDDIKELRGLLDSFSQRISRAGGRQKGGSGAGAFIIEEIPSGTVNGSNTTFTLSRPLNIGTAMVYVNGMRMSVTEDYTISGQILTMNTAPPTNSIIRVDYEKA